MNTVLAGRGRRISVPLPASSRIGRPLADTWLAPRTRAASAGSPDGGGVAVGVAGAAAGVGETGSAALLAAARIKLDPIAARTRNLCITPPLAGIPRCRFQQAQSWGLPPAMTTEFRSRPPGIPKSRRPVA